MNKKAIFLIIIIIAVITILFIASSNKENSTMKNYLNANIENQFSANQTNDSINDINDSTEREDNMKLYIKVNNRILTATLENNSSVDALIEKLEQNDITIDMEDYANFEKVGSLGFDLPKNDKQITTQAGDIILYQGNQITIYYDTNSWNFTKLGKIDNITQEELREILGAGDITVTFSLEN